MNADRLLEARLTLVRVCWLILPVVLAGVGHVAALKMNLLRPLAVPIDRGACWRGRQVFGSNKTWRGFVLMTALSALATGLQARLAQRRRWLAVADVAGDARVNPWMAGALSGLTYCLAELPNSFVKRRIGIVPGTYTTSLQYLIDQTDSVAGCVLALRLIYRPSRREVVLSFALGMAIHIAIDQLMYAIGVKRRR